MSMESTGADRVVVGWDGSDAARPALEWAAREAEARRAELVILMAQEMTVSAPEMGWGFGVDALLRESTERLLTDAQAEAERAHPRVKVATQGVAGSPAAALIEASKHAQMVVAGTRGAGGFPGLLLGGVAGALASHAHCPAVLVPGGYTSPAEPGPVVVGVDGSPQSARAAAFAFAEADGRGVPVVAIHAWTLAFYGGVVPTDEGSEAYRQMRQEQDAVMDGSLARGVEAHPAVQVDRRFVRSTSVKALADASEGASMVVVGSRGRGGFSGMLLGSTSRQLLQSTRCPVAVVRV